MPICHRNGPPRLALNRHSWGLSLRFWLVGHGLVSPYWCSILGVIFVSGGICSYCFRLLHHQKSIKIWVAIFSLAVTG